MPRRPRTRALNDRRGATPSRVVANALTFRAKSVRPSRRTPGALGAHRPTRNSCRRVADRAAPIPPLPADRGNRRRDRERPYGQFRSRCSSVLRCPPCAFSSNVPISREPYVSLVYVRRVVKDAAESRDKLLSLNRAFSFIRHFFHRLVVFFPVFLYELNCMLQIRSGL